MKGIIYKYTSPSGKSYIGQTVRPEERMAKHRRMAGDDCAFHRAIKKYGFENFTYEVLMTIDLEDKQELKQKLDFFEKFYIRKYKTFENGYNMTAGGGGCLGFSHIVSEEAKEKLSIAHTGKKLSEEHKKKISDGNKGKVFSEDTKGRMSAAQKNRSEEHKKHLSEAQKGKTLSEEHRQKLREAWARRKEHGNGVPWNKGKTGIYSDETRHKISEAAKKMSRDEKEN